MRVKSLHVENMLTFGSFDLDFDRQRRIVVGPNAAGKSNLVRVIDLVQKAVDSVSGSVASPALLLAADQVLRSFVVARHHGEPPDRPAVVRLAFELTTPSERAELCSYVQEALLYSFVQEISSGDSYVRVELARWVDEEVTDERLTPLMSGALVLKHAGMPHVRWEISYEFSLDGADYLWLLANLAASSAQTRWPRGWRDWDLVTTVPGLGHVRPECAMTGCQPITVPLPSVSPSLHGVARTMAGVEARSCG